jgi:nitric oxide reductase subunit C
VPSSTLEPPTPVPAPTAAPEPPTPDPALAERAVVERGLKLYRELYCGTCHQLGAAGTAGLFGPSHDGLGATAAQRIGDPGYTGAATSAAGYIRESILNPAAYLVPDYASSNHPMPAFSSLSDADLDALVQMLVRQ